MQSMPSMGNRGFNSNGMMQNMVQSTPAPLPIQPEIIKGVPLDPLSTQIQEERFIANNKYLKNEHQITYVNVPGSNHPGVELFERLQLAFESGLEDEVRWALNTCLKMSVTAPYSLSLKKVTFLLDHLIYYFNYDKLYDQEKTGNSRINSDINMSLDSAIILRNLAQDIDNAGVIALDLRLRDIILAVLNNDLLINTTMIDDLYDSVKELLRYTLDIAETVTSYISPAPKDDPLFLSLMNLLTKSSDRSSIITILRSLSRLMVRSNNSKQHAVENLTNEVLDQITSYLSLCSPNSIKDPHTTDLIIASVDFLYQYCLPGDQRICDLLNSNLRSLTIKKYLPKLLTFNVDYQTEFSNEMSALRLISRIKPPAPLTPPDLNEELIERLNNLSEPERATAWMRSSYVAVEEGEVTQVSLWRSYESAFTNSEKKLLPAVDFIKNVSNAFPNSSAMVINLGEGQRRFIIKGIEPRRVPVSVSVGKAEALNRAPLKREDDVKNASKISKYAVQEHFNLFNYASNSNLQPNEVNTSSALLLNCIIKNEDYGRELFIGSLELINSQLLRMPKLLPHIYDTIQALEY